MLEPLYKYIREIDDIMSLATDEDGLISDEAAEELDRLLTEKDQKIDNCLGWYKERMAIAKALKDEKMRIADRQARAEKDAEWIKGYLQRCLDGEKYESVAGKISYRKSQKVEVSCLPVELPDDFVNWTASPDKSALKVALKEGAKIEGVCLVDKINTIIT